MAGYDPQESIAFWQRMAAQPGNNKKPPELLSTHPADNTRIAKIKSYIPEAMFFYQQQVQSTQPMQAQPEKQADSWQSIIK
jgi:predicted Zn-dependent protease